MAILAQAILDAAIELRKKQNGVISEKDLEDIIETVMKGDASRASGDSLGSLENLQQFQKEENGRVSLILFLLRICSLLDRWWVIECPIDLGDRPITTGQRCTSFLQVRLFDTPV